MIYIVCFQAGHTGACDPAPVYGDLRRTWGTWFSPSTHRFVLGIELKIRLFSKSIFIHTGILLAPPSCLFEPESLTFTWNSLIQLDWGVSELWWFPTLVFSALRLQAGRQHHIWLFHVGPRDETQVGPHACVEHLYWLSHLQCVLS